MADAGIGDIGHCRRCDGWYSKDLLDEQRVCVDCREGCCGTSKAPRGWFCTRPVHDEGPCAAHPICGDDHWVFANCLSVRCPCWVHSAPGPCPGTLRSAGRNVKGNLTFLQCDECACMYVADDLPRPDEYCYEEGEEGDPECETGGWLTGNPELVTCKRCIERFNLKKRGSDG